MAKLLDLFLLLRCVYFDYRFFGFRYALISICFGILQFVDCNFILWIFLYIGIY